MMIARRFTKVVSALVMSAGLFMIPVPARADIDIECYAGGPGSGKCDISGGHIGNCGISCITGYACCNDGDCHCVVSE